MQLSNRLNSIEILSVNMIHIHGANPRGSLRDVFFEAKNRRLDGRVIRSLSHTDGRSMAVVRRKM